MREKRFCQIERTIGQNEKRKAGQNFPFDKTGIFFLLFGDLMTIAPFDGTAEFGNDDRYGFLRFRMNVVK